MPRHRPGQEVWSGGWDAGDDEMDELYASLMAELGSGRMTLPVTMEMTLIARFYERLGDHAEQFVDLGFDSLKLMVEYLSMVDHGQSL